MSSTTRDAKDQPLEDENRPGRPAGPSRHWQTSADALYAMAREVSRLRGAVVTERHWCAEYLRGRETNLVKTRPPARHQPPATSPQHNTTQQHNTHKNLATTCPSGIRIGIALFLLLLLIATVFIALLAPLTTRPAAACSAALRSSRP